MSRPKFLADHDLNEHIVSGVLRREPTVELVRAREAALQDAPDHEILEYAATHGLVVVSHDVSTMVKAALDLSAAGLPQSGLLMVPQRESVAAVIESLLLIASASEAEEWAGQIGFLPL